MRKQPESPKELGRPVVAPSKLVNLSLYSKDYNGFILAGWPAGVPYPSDAKALAPVGETGPMTGWVSYKILAAFCIGSLKNNGKRRLMSFVELEWGTHSCGFLFHLSSTELASREKNFGGSKGTIHSSRCEP